MGIMQKVGKVVGGLVVCYCHSLLRRILWSMHLVQQQIYQSWQKIWRNEYLKLTKLVTDIKTCWATSSAMFALIIVTEKWHLFVFHFLVWSTVLVVRIQLLCFCYKMHPTPFLPSYDFSTFWRFVVLRVNGWEIFIQCWSRLKRLRSPRR